MLTLGKPDHCANSDCGAIYLVPKQYEPLMSFCPCCRLAIEDKVNFLDYLLEEAEDDGSCN
jgi:hypothetical protein